MMSEVLKYPIFVTGGAGFIGSALVDSLIAKGNHVVTIDKFIKGGRLKNLANVLKNKRHILVRGDVGDTELIRKLLAEHRPGLIYHLAAETHVDRSIDTPIEFFHNNAVATASLLENARLYWRTIPDAHRNFFRFIQISTDEVFGSLGNEGEFSEDSSIRPNSPYAASKACSDSWAFAYHQTYRFPVIITHCGNNYGPKQLPEKLIPLMLLRAIEGKELPVYGNGQNVRDWIHVNDHIAALQAIAHNGALGQRYLIGAHDEWRNIDLVEEICRLLDQMYPFSKSAPHSRLIKLVDDRPGHDYRYALNPNKLRRLGWRATKRLNSDLYETLDWYLENHKELTDNDQIHREPRPGVF